MIAIRPIPIKKRSETWTLDASAFKRWLRGARKGDAAIYHIGALANEISDPRAHVLRTHRDRVLQMAAAGLVILAQRRARNIEGFEYLAIRTALLIDEGDAA